MDKLEAAKELQKMIDLLPERLDITERRRKEALEIAIKELKNMLKGIDVSEHNGVMNWTTVKNAGMDFAIIRLGFGNKHLDGSFYDNFNGAKMAGLKVGVYYYSYAMTPEEAKAEAQYLLYILKDCISYRLKVKLLTRGKDLKLMFFFFK